MARLGFIEFGTRLKLEFTDEEELCASIKVLKRLAEAEVSDPAHRNRAG